jgi:hypothetical protein
MGTVIPGFWEAVLKKDFTEIKQLKTFLSEKCPHGFLSRRKSYLADNGLKRKVLVGAIRCLSSSRLATWPVHPHMALLT